MRFITQWFFWGREKKDRRWELRDLLWVQVQASDLTERQELLIVALGDIDHQVLRALWKLTRKQAWEMKKEKQHKQRRAQAKACVCPAVTDLDIRRRRWKAEPQSPGGARCCPGSYSSPSTHSDGPVHNSRKGLWWGTAVEDGQHKLLFCVPEHCCKQFAAPLVWTWLPCDHMITGQTRGRRWTLPYSLSSSNSKVCIYLCPCICPHSLWHNSFQYERRNRSAPHWPHSPPRWRRDLRCAGGRMPLWRWDRGVSDRGHLM